MDVLFPIAEYWWFYLSFLVMVLFFLALDLGVFHRKDHVVPFREALGWTITWLVLALAFNYGFYQYCLNKFDQVTASRLALEFLGGYVMEQSLSVDNLFVFIVIFKFFAVPPQYQHRVLFFGILGALFFRAVFISLGSILMAYSWVVWFFGAILLFTGIKLFFNDENEIEPEKNIAIRVLKKLIPISPKFHGHDFFARINGVLHATPLLVCLAVVEVSDVIFAVDSVPAIFGLTKEPMIVFTSNVFAILGLRSLYFLIAGVMDLFRFLKYGLGVILIFVGLKMTILEYLYGGHFPITWSLGFIIGTLAISIVLSILIKPKENPEP